MIPFSKSKFLSLTQEAQHKKCCELLKKAVSSPERDFRHYIIVSGYMGLSPIDRDSIEMIEGRFHYHRSKAEISLRECDFLISVTTKDKEEAKEWLGVWTYLDSLRSTHNVGSIVRTVEAFRLGPIRLSPSMLMGKDHPQIQKTSMHCYPFVNLEKATSLDELPRPWIALETAPHASSVQSFSFPSSCTLIVGNEERGVSQELLKRSDVILQIPLRGRKNSLNVACAFAILASKVASDLG